MNTTHPLRFSIIFACVAGLAACSQNPVNPDSTPTPIATPPTTTAPASTGAATAPVLAGDLSSTGIDANAAGRSAGALDQAGALPSIGAPDQRSVYFDYDRFDIRDEAKNLVIDHGNFLVGRADAKMLIQGHADERGSREYNLALGQRRADAVKRALLAQGVKEENIESVSLGEEKPKATGRDEAAWAENRRADMLYKGEY